MGQMNLFAKIETQTQRTNIWTKKEKGRWDGSGDGVWHIYTAMYKTDN